MNHPAAEAGTSVAVVGGGAVGGGAPVRRNRRGSAGTSSAGVPQPTRDPNRSAARLAPQYGNPLSVHGRRNSRAPTPQPLEVGTGTAPASKRTVMAPAPENPITHDRTVSSQSPKGEQHESQ